MSDRQRALVQCPICRQWYILSVRAGKRGFVSFEDLVAGENVLKEECYYTNHRGRKRASK